MYEEKNELQASQLGLNRPPLDWPLVVKEKSIVFAHLSPGNLFYMKKKRGGREKKEKERKGKEKKGGKEGGENQGNS